MDMNVTNFLSEIAFSSLLLLMLLYWSQAAFFGREKYKIVDRFVFFLAILSLTALLCIRWIESGHFPSSNLYESLLFLSWCFLSLTFLFPGSNEPGSLNQTSFFKSFRDLGAGVILAPLSLLTFGFAFLSLPKEMQQSTALVPALQSNWLMMHVTVMILSYAFLVSGSILSIAFLISIYYTRGEAPSLKGVTRFDFTGSEKRSHFDEGLCESVNPLAFGISAKADRALLDKDNYSCNLSLPEVKISKGADSSQTLRSTKDEKGSTRVPLYELDPWQKKLDNYSYRILALGFPLLTIGILSGAVWANEAWGSYWSWDPKETWAFITWLVFAIYLHTRITKGWTGEKPAIVASLGFFMVWFCYLGVNLLGTGLHSYGWFSFE